MSGATVTNNGAVYSSTNGKLGGCYNFTNQNIVVPSNNFKSEFTNNQASLAAWVKVTTSHSAYAQALVLGTQGTSWNNILFGIDINGSGTPIANASTGSAYTNLSFGTAIKDGVWHHIAYTYNAGTMKVYLDGVQKATTTTSNTPAWTNSTNLYIGGNSGGEKFQNGDGMNDVRVYNHCLSPMEVKELAKGLILHYPLNRNGWGQENLITNSKLDGSWTYPSSSYSDKYSPITTIVPSATQYTLSFDAKSTVNGDKIRTHYYSPNTTTTCVSSQGITKTAADGNMDFTLTTQWKRYWVIYTQTETTAVKHLICPRLVSGQGTGTVSVKNVKFEEGSIATPWCPNSADVLATTMGLNSTTEYDCSGFCNNGTRTGTFSWTSDTPKYSVSTKFLSNTYISYTQPVNSMYQATYAFWVKMPSFPSYGMLHGTVNNPASGDTPWFALNTEGSELWAYFGNNSPNYHKVSGTLNTNSWYHCVWVWNNGVSQWYLNGNAVGNTVTWTGRTYITNSTNASIGDSYTGSSWGGTEFPGWLSDFRIYATALSASDVKSLYQNSAYIDSSGNVYGAVHTEV